MSTTTTTTDVSQIAGNAPVETKKILTDRRILNGDDGRRFAESITTRLKLVQVSINTNVEEPERKEAKVALDTVVQKDMANGSGNMHGGCIATFVDVCSTMPLIVINHVTNGRISTGVTQSLNIVYHSPAAIGDKIRIVSTSVAVGGRTMTARCEIWNVTHHRLVASGVHIKMQPSEPKPKL